MTNWNGGNFGSGPDYRQWVRMGGVDGEVLVALAWEWDRQILQRRRRFGRKGGTASHARRRVFASVPEVLRGESGGILDSRDAPVVDKRGVDVRDWSHPSAVRTGRRIRNPELDQVQAWSREDLVRCGRMAYESRGGRWSECAGRVSWSLRRWLAAECG